MDKHGNRAQKQTKKIPDPFRTAVKVLLLTLFLVAETFLVRSVLAERTETALRKKEFTDRVEAGFRMRDGSFYRNTEYVKQYRARTAPAAVVVSHTSDSAKGDLIE
ncbi:MAG: hypothetical protein LBQ97_08330 [Fusobacteriaceae bacterium]|jgi:hypothetical protein|nr:hypothetical protein [Fusobacteriaceae bacterium]